jgi:DDE family transposase
VIVDQQTEKVLATAFGKGNTHDFQLFKESRSPIAHSVKALADTGFQGLAHLHANTRTPTKKSKLHPLTQDQKADNRALSR